MLYVTCYMVILGIETSCDDTSVAVVRNGSEVLSCVTHTQADLHAKTGGVVPEVAAREHVVHIIPVIEQALKEARIKLDDIDRIAVTKEPGLLPSLLIGLQTAKTLGYSKNIPVDEINHTRGHIYSNWLERDAKKVVFPILILTVSGGHNDLILMKDHGSTMLTTGGEMEILGTTLDDAAGEAFDKVARLLGLGYPGGPEISRVAERGSADAFDFPRAWLSAFSHCSGWDKENFNFSFSGLKTAVLKVIEDRKKEKRGIETQFVADVSASFEEAVCDVLSAKLVYAVEVFGVKEVHLAGGVSANKRLRRMVCERLPKNVILKNPVRLKYCTDNGAMVAAAGYYR